MKQNYNLAISVQQKNIPLYVCEGESLYQELPRLNAKVWYLRINAQEITPETLCLQLFASAALFGILCPRLAGPKYQRQGSFTKAIWLADQVILNAARWHYLREASSYLQKDASKIVGYDRRYNLCISVSLFALFSDLNAQSGEKISIVSNPK